MINIVCLLADSNNSHSYKELNWRNIIEWCKVGNFGNPISDDVLIMYFYVGLFTEPTEHDKNMSCDLDFRYASYSCNDRDTMVDRYCYIHQYFGALNEMRKYLKMVVAGEVYQY